MNMWVAGWVLCRICSLRWVAVRPECVEDDMQCPNCMYMTGSPDVNP